MNYNNNKSHKHQAPSVGQGEVVVLSDFYLYCFSCCCVPNKNENVENIASYVAKQMKQKVYIYNQTFLTLHKNYRL